MRQKYILGIYDKLINEIKHRRKTTEAEILGYLKQCAPEPFYLHQASFTKVGDGDSFHFREQDLGNITKLVAYFLDDETTAAQFGLDRGKGILLSGPVGCGKTTLMSLMRYVPKPNKKFLMKPCRDISFEFIKDGYEVIHRHSHGHNTQAEHKNYCFDDLGTENNLKYFGNECNVMAEILLSRYDIFISKKICTHITTNLSASEIESAYGNRVRSRMRNMFNLIAFDKATKDKR